MLSRILPWAFPEQASNFAAEVDALYLFLVAISLVFSVGIALTLLVFAIRYQRSTGRAENHHAPAWLEIVWIVVPLAIVIVIFAWGAKVAFDMRTMPAGAMQIYATGKQWMWKFQHPEGRREINELHVPVGQPVRIIMGSEDVIHSLFVPAFRVKQDVVPGRFTEMWFEANRVGTYHLFCTEYCGRSHSQMIGSVIVMEQEKYQEWLSGGPSGVSMDASGAQVFEELGCGTCHEKSSTGRGPSLEGLHGHAVELASGSTVMADADYIRESILNPAAKVVRGYEPIMPTFQGLVTEEQIQQLVAYIQSLGGAGEDS